MPSISERSIAPKSTDCRAGTVASLAALQFFAVFWVVLNQFREHLGLEVGARSGLVAKGYLGAGLFFVVGGFLICGQWARPGGTGGSRYGSLLWRRLAFIYPLHVLILVVMIAAVFLRLGQPLHRTSFLPGDLLGNLLLVQAWGAVKTDSWNFPSWLISAEWFAALIFPAIAWVALRALRPSALSLAAALALFVAMFLIAQAKAVLFTDMTTQIGALQTIPAYLLGVALWRLDGERCLSQGAALALAMVAVAWIAVGASMRVSDVLIWPAFGPLVFGVAQAARSAMLGRYRRPLAYLGGLAIPMLLIYLPVDIAYFRVGHLLFGTVHGAPAWLLWSGVFPAIMTAAMVVRHFVQRPIWLWLRRGDPFSSGGQPAATTRT